jgi:hypothetical protein
MTQKTTVSIRNVGGLFCLMVIVAAVLMMALRIDLEILKDKIMFNSSKPCESEGKTNKKR